MSNIKGGTNSAMKKDIYFKLNAISQKRFSNGASKGDHLTHSLKLLEKREQYVNDFIKYIESNEISGKLNLLFTKENLTNFFDSRFENLSNISQENYLRGFSSLLQGLSEKNVDIPLHIEDKSFFDDRVAILKNEADTVIENRYIDNVETVIQNLYEDRHISGLLAQTQYELSIRQAEAYELLKNPSKYIDDGIVNNLIGKGNHMYEPKLISFELEQKILQNQDELPSKSQYWNDLNKYNISSHDFRFTSARDKYEEKLRNGVSEITAKLEISKTLNHCRLSITNYYLSRT
ncbi:hypothetical protein [Malaciobacter marinus]|jgi:hypothetical protein|uniref:hypothetical protein n=1 Tax=Malaciobacter marinus TaxID=505249 RepID=UPI0009A68E6D|nr:hypothetical protein [Malaciobacter marinus]SKB32462.1 hypothetical protein SAMN06295997_10571 [Malaciobacter marinus]